MSYVSTSLPDSSFCQQFEALILLFTLSLSHLRRSHERLHLLRLPIAHKGVQLRVVDVCKLNLLPYPTLSRSTALYRTPLLTVLRLPQHLALFALNGGSDRRLQFFLIFHTFHHSIKLSAFRNQQD